MNLCLVQALKFFQYFNLDIKYKPGKKNIVSNTLSYLASSNKLNYIVSRLELNTLHYTLSNIIPVY